MRFAVYIGATGGPVRIERFVAEGTPLSEVFVGRAVEPLISMATAFDNFMQPGRPPERLFGQFEDGGWRMDISAPIDSGDSWELAVLIAFGLAREGRLARPEERSDAAIWLTGRVNADLQVGSVGHVADKLSDSRILLDDLEVPCTCFVPVGAGIDDERVIEVSGATEIVERLGIRVDALRSTSPGKKISPSMKVAVATLILMLVGTTITVGYLDNAADRKPVEIAPGTGPAVPVITVTALRPASGSNCAAVHFNAVTPVREKLSPGAGRIELKADRTLCGLGVAVDGQPGNHRPGSTFAAFSGSDPAEIHGQPGEPDAPVMVDGHHEWSAMLPAGIDTPFEMVVTVAGEAGMQTGTASLTVRVSP